MGWASGSELANELWLEIKPFLSPADHEELACLIYERFCDYDADDWDGTSVLEADAGINQETDPWEDNEDLL